MHLLFYSLTIMWLQSVTTYGFDNEKDLKKREHLTRVLDVPSEMLAEEFSPQKLKINDEDYKKIKRKADTGDTKAAYLLGTALATGRRLPPHRQAAMYYLSIASQTDPRAMNLLGIFYDPRWNVQGNSEKAAELYRSAAQKGFKAALDNFYELKSSGKTTLSLPLQEDVFLIQPSHKKNHAQTNKIPKDILSMAVTLKTRQSKFLSLGIFLGVFENPREGISHLRYGKKRIAVPLNFPHPEGENFAVFLFKNSPQENLGRENLLLDIGRDKNGNPMATVPARYSCTLKGGSKSFFQVILPLSGEIVTLADHLKRPKATHSPPSPKKSWLISQKEWLPPEALWEEAVSHQGAQVDAVRVAVDGSFLGFKTQGSQLEAKSVLHSVLSQAPECWSKAPPER